MSVNITQDNDFQQIIQSVFDPVSNSLNTNPSGGSLVPEAFDYIALTYVPSGNGVGEIQTVTYKTGGSSGTTVAILTLAYNSNNKLVSTTKS